MFKNKSALFIICMVLIMTVVVGSTVALIIVKTDDILNVFRPQQPTGDLMITKTVTHPFGENYQIPENISFTFQVDLGIDYANKTIKTSAGDLKADGNGRITVSAKPGLSVAIYEIATEQTVTVTETDILPGFAPEGGAQQQVSIPKRTQVSVVYNNIYTPAPAPCDLTLTGIKTLAGRDWQEGDSFTFSLEAMQTQWTELGTCTVTYDAENPDFNRFDFTDLLTAYPFDHVGTYSFRISEKEGTIGGIAYDPTVSYVDVTVTDTDMDGALEISGINASQNATVTENDIFVTIENTYAPEGSAEVMLQILKVLEDKSGQGLLPEGFAFELKDAQGEVVATSQTTGAAGETQLKLVFEAIDAGKSFDYTLTEIKGDKPGMIYDETAYDLRVDVIDNLDGTINAQIYEVDTTQEPTNTCQVTFRNTYAATATDITFAGTKHLEGRDLAAGEFLFHLYETDSTFQISEDAVPSVVSNDAQGAFGYSAITYDRVGTYYYVIKEDASAPMGGITYDDTVCQITVTVTDVDGSLQAQQTITDQFGNATGLEFTNRYSATAAVVQLLAEKTLEGAELTANQFQFLLFETDQEYAYSGTPVLTATNDANGQIAFTQLRFEEAGTYYYVMVEDGSQAIPGMTYDRSVYGLMIQVVDDGNGKLEPTVTMTLRTETVIENTQQRNDSGDTTESETESETRPEVETVVQWVAVEKLSFTNIYEEPITEPTTEPAETTEPGTEPTQPGTQPSTEPSVPPTGEPTPPTGDESNPGLFVALLIVSGIALISMIVGFVLTMRKKKKS